MKEGWACGACMSQGRKVLFNNTTDVIQHFELHLRQYEQGSNEYLNKLQELVAGLTFCKER